jgi:hypothetical protein
MDLSKTGVYHDLDLYDPSEHQFVNEQGSSLARFTVALHTSGYFLVGGG